jgi:hypothetical protein
MTAARNSVKLDILAGRWSLDWYLNGARPDYGLVAPEGLTEDERKEYELALEQKLGVGKSHKPIILEDGVTDIKTFSWAPKELQWLEHKKVGRDEIGGIFGIPDGIMGWGAESYDTATKVDGDVRALWILTLEPIIRFRDDALTRYGRRVGLLTPAQKLVTDLSSVAVLQEDVTNKVNMLNVLAGRGVPVNQAAEFLKLGLGNVPGGDVGYLPFSLVPVEAIESGETLDEERTEDRPENRSKSTRKRAPAYGSKQHAAILQRKQKRAKPFVEEMQRQLKRFIQDQQNEVARNVREGKDFGRGRYKQDETIPPVNAIFDVDKWILEFKDRFENVVKATVYEIGQDEIDALNALGADLNDFEGRPEVLSTIDGILAHHADKTQNNTFLELSDIFIEAERNGESITAIQERLSAFFGDKKSNYQTERIARTTINAASNAGESLAWEQSEVVSGKTWLSALIPNRTRDAHADAHGQTVRLNDSFDVGGEMLRYPGDPQGSAGNVINCLCSMIAEVEL